MLPTRPLDVFGVVGGLGPLASAEFLRTIYEYGAGDVEQTMPAVFLVSDPTVPDRTQALVNGTSELLLDRLRTTVEQIVALRCSRIVVCCVTMHAVLPGLPEDLRRRIVSLIDVVIDQVRARGERQLLFCSSGTRATNIFERHPRWPEIEPLMIRPRPDDQAAIHSFIYRIKRDGNARRFVRAAGELLDTYGVRSLTVGCTEFHLLAKAARQCGAPWRTCDPLDWIAREWAHTRGHA